MQFNQSTLRNTADQFIKALRVRDLSFSLHEMRNVWSQTVVGKDYSTALAHIKNRNTPLAAASITARLICNQLLSRNRNVTSVTACELFAESIFDDLPELSPFLYEALLFLRKEKQSCFTYSQSDPTKIGVIGMKIPGILPLNEASLPVTATNQEVEWIRSSYDFVISASNLLAGVGGKEHEIIFTTNFRAGEKRKDDVFAAYMSAFITPLSQKIASKIEEMFYSSSVADGGPIDFDEVRNIALDVIDSDIREIDISWLSISGSLCEAILDHLAARLREDLIFQQSEKEDSEEFRGALEHTAHLSIQKLLPERKFVSSET